jgi:hypothetical protein
VEPEWLTIPEPERMHQVELSPTGVILRRDLRRYANFHDLAHRVVEQNVTFNKQARILPKRHQKYWRHVIS